MSYFEFVSYFSTWESNIIGTKYPHNKLQDIKKKLYNLIGLSIGARITMPCLTNMAALSPPYKVTVTI